MGNKAYIQPVRGRILKYRWYLKVLSIVLVVHGGYSSYFFHPEKDIVDNPLLRTIPYEDVFFKTPDGLTLHGLLLKAKDKSRGTVLYMHGNKNNISVHVNNVLWLTGEGYDVFAFDYRGYGRSEGHPTFAGVHLDARTALEKVLSLPQVNKERLFVFGQSLGGAIAVYTVATSPHKGRVKAVIIDSAFSDYRLIAREKIAESVIGWPFQYPLSFFIDDSYSPVKWIKRVYPVPVLIIHGDRDGTVPVHHGSTLYDEAVHPKEFWLLKGIGHDQALGHTEIRERFVRYLRR